MEGHDQVAANKRTLLRAADRFGREHFEEYLQLYAEDAHLHFLPPELPQGRAGARLFYEAVFDAFDGLQLPIEDMVGEGEQVGLRFSHTPACSWDFPNRGGAPGQRRYHLPLRQRSVHRALERNEPPCRAATASEGLIRD
jgi:hypothetical protein